MAQVGIDYESNPEGFLAATRQVTEASAKALGQFDMTNAAMRRMGVSYLSTADSAKQAALIQRMTALQVANDMASSASRQVAAQREVATAARESTVAAGQGRSAWALMQAAFRPDNLRGFRGELRETAEAGRQSGGSMLALGKTTGVLAGSLLVTAAAAPLINRAFSALQGPASALDKALFGDIDRMKEMRKEAAATGQQLLASFGAGANAASVANLGVLDTKATLLTASLQQMREEGHKEVFGHDIAKGVALLSEAAQVEKQNATQADQLNRHLQSLAAQLHDTGASSNGYAKELALANAQHVDLINAGPEVVARLADIGSALDADAAKADHLAQSAASAQSAIAAMIAIGGNLPGPLAKARATSAGAAAAASIAQTIAQAGSLAQAQANEAAVYVVPASRGGGGAGYTPAMARRDVFADHISLLRQRITEQGQIHPSSVAYAKQIQLAEQDSLVTARAQEKHAQALYAEARGEKAKHAALKVLQATENDVLRATKNLAKTKQDIAKIQADQAAAAKQAAITLANAKIEAGVDWSSQVSIAQARYQEALNTLGGDKAGSAAAFTDQAAVNQALYDLQQAIKDAQGKTKDNTSATDANTKAMTGVPGGGGLPSWLALRAQANAGAFVRLPSMGGAGGTSVTITGSTFIGTSDASLARMIVKEINGAQLRDSKPTLSIP